MSEQHVYKAINAVQGAMAKVGISKSEQNTQQRYKFRGIDAVYNHLAPLLAEHKLIVMPRVTSRDVTERQTKSGGALFYVVLMMEFDFVSAEDGSKHTVVTCGEAMDSGDKATNKAMSAAYKYACFQTFCIPTEGDNDADSTTHQVADSLTAACTKHAATIEAVKNYISEGTLSAAVEAWYELSQDDMRELWVAPSKGGPFTNEERKVIKSDEWAQIAREYKEKS